MKPISIVVQKADKPVLLLPDVVLQLLGLEEGSRIKVKILSDKEVEESKEVEIMERKFDKAMKDPLFKNLISEVREIARKEGLREHQPKESMVAFYYMGRGLVWLSYPVSGKIRVHLAKNQSYKATDPDDRVKYEKTFGNYPEFYLESESDIEYCLRLIQYAILHKKDIVGRIPSPR